MNALDVAQLEFSYPDGTPALCGVNFSVAPGECLGLVGPNGAGKSTLLLALLGFVPARGQVRVGDLALTRATRSEIRRRVGLVFAYDRIFVRRSILFFSGDDGPEPRVRRGKPAVINQYRAF